MARSEKRRQKSLAKKKRKQKRARERSSGGTSLGDNPKSVIRLAGAFPIRECFCALSLHNETLGLGPLLIARDVPDGRIAFGVFLVDRYCLGVKNAFCNVLPLAEYERKLKRGMLEQEPSEPIAVEAFHQIIYGAVDYARRYGFEPHKGFALASHLLDPRDRIPPGEPVEFGRNGMPLFINGPDDDVESVLATLDRTAGEGNYHFLLGGPV